MRRPHRLDDEDRHLERPTVLCRRGLRPLITTLILLAAVLCVVGLLTRLEPLVWIGAVVVLTAGLLEMTYRL
jgi:flagellin-like protein